MNDRIDKAALKRAAAAVQDAVRRRCANASLGWPNKLKVLETWTDGWCVKLAWLKASRLSLQLWIDRYPKTKHRCFYFGFHTSNPKVMAIVPTRLPKHLRAVRHLYDSNFEKVTPQVWLLRSPLRADDYNKPIRESYRKYPNYFFGMYDRQLKRNAANSASMVSHAVDFFAEVVWLLANRTNKKPPEIVYPKLERQVVRAHLARERNAELARACKRRDGYICQVCDMNFESVYGEYGEEFAEAHHTKPLSKSPKTVKTRLQDLATVCSNCHRMLHRMDGKRSDVRRLRRVVRLNRRNH